MEADLESTGARERNPRGQGERLRTALIDAAIELLAEVQNVEALSIRAVTARAGVTPTALYLHFADKEALIEAVKERCFAELLAYPSEPEVPGDPRANLESGCRAYIQFSVDHPGYYRVLFHTTRGEVPTAIAEPHHWPRGAAEALGQLIEAVRDCLPPGTDPVPSSMMIWAGLHGYIGLRRSIPSVPFAPPDEYVKRLVDAHVPR